MSPTPDNPQIAFWRGEFGDVVAAALIFERIASQDWVAASLAGLKPVQAGRFMVYGAHDRARIQPNQIGIDSQPPGICRNTQPVVPRAA